MDVGGELVRLTNDHCRLERRATTKNNENKSACDRFPIVYLLYWNFLPRLGKLLNSHWNFELGDGDARFWSAHGTSTNPLYRKTTFPSARGLWRSDWDHTVVSEVYHLADVREAYQDLARRHTRGKIVLVP
jgi:Zinc-binding dehydrogenase